MFVVVQSLDLSNEGWYGKYGSIEVYCLCADPCMRPSSSQAHVGDAGYWDAYQQS